MDISFARYYSLPIIPLKLPRILIVFNGTETSSGRVTHVIASSLQIGGHLEPRVLFYLTKLGDCPIVLGMP